jgi:hypothetical protein
LLASALVTPDVLTNLEESELVRRFGRPDNDGFNISDINISACHCKG